MKRIFFIALLVPFMLVAIVKGCDARSLETKPSSDAGAIPTRTRRPEIAPCLRRLEELTASGVLEVKTTLQYIDAASRLCPLSPDLSRLIASVMNADDGKVPMALLLAARENPRFPMACDVAEDHAGDMLLAHRNLDACMHDAAFAPDPWGTDLAISCRVDIATYVFLDVLARYFFNDAPDGPWLIEELEPQPRWTAQPRRMIWDQFYAHQTLRSCDHALAGYSVRAERLKKAGAEWNLALANGDAAVRSTTVGPSIPGR